MARAEKGFTLIELLIVIALIGIIAALGAPFLMQAKTAANEASAISSLRALNSAQTAYSSACGGQAYTASLDTLVEHKFISPDANLTPKSGFEFVLTPGTGSTGPDDCHGDPTSTTYYATAVPVSFTSGHRAFATNSVATIWQNTEGAPAPTEPFGTTETVFPVGRQ